MVGRDILYPATSVLSFVCKVILELAPASIRYTFGKMMVLHHAFDVQVFYGNTTVLTYHSAGNFMMKISTLIANLAVGFGNLFSCLHTVFGTLLFRRQTALFPYQLFFGLTKMFRIIYYCPIGQNGKGKEPCITLALDFVSRVTSFTASFLELAEEGLKRAIYSKKTFCRT